MASVSRRKSSALGVNRVFSNVNVRNRILIVGIDANTPLVKDLEEHLARDVRSVKLLQCGSQNGWFGREVQLVEHVLLIIDVHACPNIHTCRGLWAERVRPYHSP
jgi:hypothetical protein